MHAGRVVGPHHIAPTRLSVTAHHRGTGRDPWSSADCWGRLSHGARRAVPAWVGSPGPLAWDCPHQLPALVRGCQCCGLSSTGVGPGRDAAGLSPCSGVMLILLDGRADMEFLEVLTEHLDRVLLVRGGGREVITIYS